MFDFLLTTPHCVMLLHKFMPHIHLKTPNSCAFSFIDTFSLNRHL